MPLKFLNQIDCQTLELLQNTYNKEDILPLISQLDYIFLHKIKPAHHHIVYMQTYYETHNHLISIDHIINMIEQCVSDEQRHTPIEMDMLLGDLDVSAEKSEEAFYINSEHIDQCEDHVVELDKTRALIEQFNDYVRTHASQTSALTLSTTDKILFTIQSLRETCQRALHDLYHMQQSNVSLINEIHTLRQCAKRGISDEEGDNSGF